MKRPPEWKLKKILKSLGTKVTLHKVTETLIDDEFGQTAETSEETYDIFADIQSITLEDMAFLPAGEVKEGDMWGFFLPIYVIEGEEYLVEVNDYITFNGIKYLVTRIEDQFMSGESTIRRAFLRRQVGQ